jgi:hypothetical protein
MAFYTYVVDHGEDSPSVGLKSKVNGYPVVAVSSYDLTEKFEEVRSLLEMSSRESAYNDIQQALELI